MWSLQQRYLPRTLLPLLQQGWRFTMLIVHCLNWRSWFRFLWFPLSWWPWCWWPRRGRPWLWLFSPGYLLLSLWYLVDVRLDRCVVEFDVFRAGDGLHVLEYIINKLTPMLHGLINNSVHARVIMVLNSVLLQYAFVQVGLHVFALQILVLEEVDNVLVIIVFILILIKRLININISMRLLKLVRPILHNTLRHFWLKTCSITELIVILLSLDLLRWHNVKLLLWHWICLDAKFERNRSILVL